MDQLQSMRVFIAVAEQGGFARAANMLDISNAVATRHIADLENKLGTRLMHRTTRCLSLTESGQVYFERAKKILNDLSEVEHIIFERTAEPIGVLRIVAPVDFATYCLPNVINTYTEKFPKVIPNLFLIDQNANLIDERYDVGIAASTINYNANTVSRRLCAIDFILCASTEYLKKYGLPEENNLINNHRFLSAANANSFETAIFSNFISEQSLQMQTAATANHYSIIKKLALQGMGITLLPKYLVQTEINENKLINVLPNLILPTLDMNIIYPSKSYMPAKSRSFIDHSVEFFSTKAASPKIS